MLGTADLGFLRDLVTVFAVAIVVVALLKRVGVPPIAGFIVAGILAGPRALGLIADAKRVEVLAEVGVVLLLFGIGLELSLDRLKRLWRPILFGGALQVGLTVAVVTVGSMGALGVGPAIFLGCVIAPSSTAIILRALAQRGEVDAPYGRLTLGILVFQDLCVLPMMLAIPILSGQATDTGEVLWALGKAVLILALVLGAARIAVPRALHFVAQTRQRDLFILAVSLVCLGTAWLVSLADVSLALGAFLAGLVVSGSDYRHQALADLIPFREVFTSLFFVSVGMLLDPGVVAGRAGPVLLLLLAVIAGKFAIVLLTGVLLRLPLRVAAQSATSLAHLGEFLFVLAFAGRGVLPDTLQGDLYAVATLSMLLAPWALIFGPHLAAGLGRVGLLVRLLDVKPATEARDDHVWEDHAIVAGYGITGEELAKALKKVDVPYLILDMNPENVRRAAANGEPAFFGDVTSPEVLEVVGAHEAKELVLVINDPDAACRAVRAARSCAPELHIVVRTRYVGEIPQIREAGADEVIAAEQEAANSMVAYVLKRHAKPTQ